MLRRLIFTRRYLAPIPRLPVRARFFAVFDEQSMKDKVKQASLYFEEQKYQDALSLFKEVHQDCTSGLGEKNKYWVLIQSNIANSLFKLQRYEESGQVWKQLGQYHEDIMEKTDIKSLPDDEKVKIAYPYIPYGLCLFNQSKQEEGIQAMKKGIHYMEKAFGANHSRTLQEYLRFANLLQAQKMFDQAIEYLKIYVDRKEFIVGPGDQKVMSVKLLMASIMSDRHREVEAIDIYKQVVEAATGDDKVSKNFVFTAKLLMATANKHLKNKKESLALFEELNGQVDEMLESNHVNYVKIKCFYGLGLYDQGRHDEAFKLLKEGTQLSLKHGYQNTVEAIMARHYYSLCLLGLGYSEEAITNMREVNETIKKSYGEQSEIYQKNSIDLANSLIRAQQYDEAETMLLSLKDLFIQREMGETSDYCKIMLNLTGLYFSSAQREKGHSVLSEFSQVLQSNEQLKAEFGPIVDDISRKVQEIESK